MRLWGSFVFYSVTLEKMRGGGGAVSPPFHLCVKPGSDWVRKWYCENWRLTFILPAQCLSGRAGTVDVRC